MRHTHATAALAAAALAAATLAAQQPAPARGQGPPGAERPRRPEEPYFDPAAVERGQKLLVERCGFCHGSNARGGSQGSDLTRSPIVQEDENGKQLGEFLKVGRPERNMPKFELTEQELQDLAAFLHQTIYLISNRGTYKILDIVTGDAKAGAAYFSGAGGCNTCHSPEGDLKGVGSKYEPVVLQQRFLMPRGGGGWPGQGGRRMPAYLQPTAIKAKVSLPEGESVSGALVRLTAFDVTIYDAAAGQLRSWLRKDGVPEVVLTDPLQAHIDLWRKWTDADIHNMTAYLVTLR
jgi:mono/diheme cytochrome c family protein